MAVLPSGTVTFLFTDIEGSTALLQRLGDRRYAEVLEEHRRLLRATFKERNGHEVDTQGDAFLVAFSRARDAVAAAVAAQRALTNHSLPDGASLRVRMGLHTGEPLSETEGYVGLDVHRAARICAAGHGGQILLSGTTRELVQSDLPEGTALRDLGPHHLKDLAQPQHLFQVVAPGLASDFPPLKTLDTLPNNLPRQLTSFVGRQREMGEIKHLLTTTCLLTLTGAGGSGKTRLALQVAADILDQYPDGIWQVEFASIADPTLVPQMVASALGVPEQPGRPLTQTLVDYLRPKSTLIVMDNCEHLLSACARFAAALLQACPSLRIMATSREGLGIGGELTYPVPSLSLPDPKHRVSLGKLLRYEAVRLFVERAAFSRPRFAVTNSNVSSVVQVCTQLDGIPLAIELAAARVKVLTVEQIAARLRDRFQLLTGGGRTAPSRHQTLRAAMDWSYDLLSEKERVLLRRLSVFAGGWTLEAAEAVCSGNGVEASTILDLLTSLVDKSLVNVEPQGGEARYGLLETVRQYGHERLQESGESGDALSRHRDFFLTLAEAAEPYVRASSVAWLTRMEGEHDNLRAALEWSLRNGDEEANLRLVGALAWFWIRRFHYVEGQKSLKEVLERSTGAPTVHLAGALLGSAALAWSLGDYKYAAEPAEAARALYRQLEHEGGLAHSAYVSGIVHMARGHYEEAAALLEESLARCRRLDDKWGIASSLRHGGQVAARRGDYGRAEILLEESVRLYREAGNDLGVAWALRHLAMAAVNQGDFRRARELLTQSLALFQEGDDKEGIAYSLAGLGRVARHEAANDRAAGFYREGLILSRAIRSQWATVECLFGLAALVSQGDPHRAARLFGAAEAWREAIDYLLPVTERAEFEQILAASRAALGPEVFASAWTDGRAMAREQAIEYALEDVK